MENLHCKVLENFGTGMSWWDFGWFEFSYWDCGQLPGVSNTRSFLHSPFNLLCELYDNWNI
jgi:hypothetical protein